MKEERRRKRGREEDSRGEGTFVDELRDGPIETAIERVGEDEIGIVS